MFYRIRKRLNYQAFNSQTKRILDTPPMPYREAPLAIVSMVSNLDPQMYIIAVKSFYHRLGRGKVVAIVDADMPGSSRDLIRKHLGPVEFVHLESIDTGKCQRGGTWERVLYCVERSEREYVIQIDCDSLCTGDIPEVLDSVENNRAFTLAEGLPIKPLFDWVEDGERNGSNHIVNTFEMKARQYPGGERLKYVRGSSGFAGFAKGGVSRQLLEDFHEKMAALHGERWKEWGTEQIASNFAVANSPGALALPNPKYSTYTGGELPAESSLLHFIGTFRFKGEVFSSLANRQAELIAKG